MSGKLLDSGRPRVASARLVAPVGVGLLLGSRFQVADRLALARSGRSDEDNLQPLSGRPHHVKDETDWHAHREPDGTITWTSPTGHVYTDPPHQHPIDHTAEWINKPPDPDPPLF